MSKVISFSNQAARLEDRAGGGEEWQLVMGEQSRLYTGDAWCRGRCRGGLCSAEAVENGGGRLMDEQGARLSENYLR